MSNRTDPRTPSAWKGGHCRNAKLTCFFLIKSLRFSKYPIERVFSVGVDTISLSRVIHPKRKNLPYRTLVNNSLRPVSKLRHHRNRIATGRAGKGPARTRAGIKHPFLRPVDRDPEFSIIPRNAGSGHNLEMDR